MEDSFSSFLLNPKYHDVLSVIKGFRNGIVYGAKVRFPHAFVMTFLFREGSLKKKFKFILKATYQHSRNLGMFVVLYKSLMIAQRNLEGIEKSHHAFIAGLVGGYLVFGNDNNVNQQIVLYLFSRIAMGLARTAVKYDKVTTPEKTFPYFAALVWGIVMWLFRHERETLQLSLQSSMHYLYNLSEKWDGWKTLLWHNV